MKSFVFIYHNKSKSAPTPAAMQAWGDWFSAMGDHVVDNGYPIAGPVAIVASGNSSIQDDSIIGYSVIEAKNLDEAVELAMGSPLANANGTAVHVYETGQM